MLSIKKMASIVIISLIMHCVLVSSVWASGGAVDDSAICDKGSSVLINVLANDQTELKYIGPISQPKHGTAFIEGGKIRYTPDPNWSGIDTFTYSVPLNDENMNKFCIDTGHYYEYYKYEGEINRSWDYANVNASLKTLYGLKGYLVTITSQEENKFIVENKIVPTDDSSWMGATDDPNVTGDADNNWYWATGPEVGTKFFFGQYGSGEGKWISGPECYVYCNWASGEPNNGSGDGESYGEFYFSGSWNDLGQSFSDLLSLSRSKEDLETAGRGHRFTNSKAFSMKISPVISPRQVRVM